MDSHVPSPTLEVARPWALTRWLGALAIVAAVSLIAIDAGSGSAHPVAQGRLPHTPAPAPRAAVPDLLGDVLGRTTTTTVPPTTTTTAGVPPPVEDTTLHTPEDVPDPSVRRPISVIGRIAIPTIGLIDALRNQITQESIDLGPSHWPGTAAPGGYGNVVIGGHRNTYSAPFHDLGNLHAGDPIVLTDSAGRQFAYAVTEMFVVQPDAMWITDQMPGHTLTLFTCHPIGSSAERLVIRATLT
jgi:sortase A